MATHQHHQDNGFFRSRTGLACLVFIGVAAFYLITEHTAHLFGFLPYALFLLCPLMHLFMHGGHKASDGPDGQQSPETENRPS